MLNPYVAAFNTTSWLRDLSLISGHTLEHSNRSMNVFSISILVVCVCCLVVYNMCVSLVSFSSYVYDRISNNHTIERLDKAYES